MECAVVGFYHQSMHIFLSFFKKPKYFNVDLVVNHTAF